MVSQSGQSKASGLGNRGKSGAGRIRLVWMRTQGLHYAPCAGRVTAAAAAWSSTAAGRLVPAKLLDFCCQLKLGWEPSTLRLIVLPSESLEVGC